MIRKLAMVSACVLLAACANRAAVPDHVALPAAPPPGELPSVIGLTESALRATFGEPAFVRKEGDTQFWRYNGAACHAFFFLYKQNGVLTVQHVESLPPGAAIGADNACINALRLHPIPVPVS